MLSSELLDGLARLRLSHQQAALLLELRDVKRGYLRRWRANSSNPSEAAVISRRMHRLAERGYLELRAPLDGLAVRFTHVALTATGRQVADTIAELDGSAGLRRVT